MTTLAEQVGGPRRVFGGPFGSKLTQADYVESGVPVIRGNNMEFSGRWIGGKFAFVSKEKVARDFTSNLASPGDIVVTQRGTLGQVSMIPTESEYNSFVISQSQMAISVDNQIADPLFVYYYLRSPAFLQYVTSETIQTGVPHINLRILREAKVRWPKLKLQERIATVLGSLDDKIELNRRMNETLEAMAQAIFRDWFVDFGPTRRQMAGATGPVQIMGGLTPDLEKAATLAPLFPPTLADNGLPAGWEMTSTDQLIEFNPREALRRGEVAPYTDMASLPTKGSSTEPPINRAFGSGMRFRNGDALIARITPCLENGKAAYVDFLPDDDTIGWGSTEFFVLRSRPPVPAPFAYCLIRHPEFRETAIRSMTGTSGRQRAQIETLKSFAMPGAPEEVFQTFGEFIGPWYAVICLNREQNETLAALRDLLLPKLMLGEIRLTDVEAAA